MALLSDKEQKLLDYIQQRKADITLDLIKVELGESYLGAIGRLIRDELIEVYKNKIEDKSNYYGCRFVKCYKIKKEN